MADDDRAREPGDDDDLVPLAQVLFKEAVAKAWDDLAGVGVGARRPKLLEPYFKPASSLFAKKFPEVPWLIKGVMRQRAVFAIGGEPKSAKTWTGIEACMAIATDTKMFGEFKVGLPGPTAMYLVEDEEISIRDRLRALAASRHMDPEQACARMHYEERRPLNLLDQGEIADFVASVRSLPEKPVAVMLDPLRDMHSGDENESGATKLVTDGLRALRSVLDATIITVHHTGKSSADNKGRRMAQRFRGSGAFHGALDGSLVFDTPNTDSRTFWESATEVETRAGQAFGRFHTRLQLEDDIHGGAIRAEWKIQREKFTEPPKPNGAKMGPVELRLVGLLRKRWRTANDTGVEVEPIGVATLARFVDKDRRLVGDSLKLLFEAGKAYHLEPGHGRSNSQVGWVYRPSEEEGGDDLPPV